MSKPIFSILALVTLMLSSVASEARDSFRDDKQKKSSEKSSQPASVFKLEFIIEESVAGKRVSARSMTLLLEEEEKGRVRMGNKSALASPESDPKFVELGVKFDCKVAERDGQIALEVRLDINDLNSGQDAKPDASMAIRNFQAEFETIIPLAKETAVGVFEDSTSNRRYELRATVTRVK